jgi:hypothetical protein
MDPQHIIDICEANWDANKTDCNHFVKAVADALGVTLFSASDDADDILDKLSTAAGWQLIPSTTVLRSMRRWREKWAGARHDWGINQLLGRLFAQHRNDGRTDLEAAESALGSAFRQAGAAALSQLLQFEAPAAEQRQLPCPYGHHAR